MEIANCIFGMNQRYVPYIYMQEKRVGSYGELWDIHQKNKFEELGLLKKSVQEES